MYVLQLEGDTIACSSERCLSSLLQQGWKLLEAGQLGTLDGEGRQLVPSPRPVEPASTRR